MELVYYYPGIDSEEEVMLESTAELMSYASINTRFAVIENDEAAMADGLTSVERRQKQFNNRMSFGE